MFEFLQKLFGKAPVDLEVSLDTSLNPAVIISDPDLKASGRRIRWNRKQNESFTCERLNDLDQAYFNCQSINKSRTRVTCNNRAPDTGDTDQYEYEIIVKWNNILYSSTKSGAPGGGKPVIRN